MATFNFAQAFGSGGLTANNGNKPQNYVGPVLPGQTIGGVNPLSAKPSGQVLGSSTTNTSNGGGGGSSSNANPHINPATGAWDDNYYARLQQNALLGNKATLDAIQKRLDFTRQQAQQQIDNATSARDYITNFINQRYPELTNRVEQQRTNALNDLATQETQLQNIYDQANAQARARSQDAALQNRMAARAGNRLGSSFYDQLVSSNNENLGKTLGASDLERINKMAALNTQKTTTNQNYDNTINDLETQKNQAQYQAMDDYNKAVQAANALSQAGLVDFGTSEAEAANNLQSKLDAIDQWAQGVMQGQNTLSGLSGGLDTTLSGLSGANQSFISNNAQTPQATALNSYTPTAFNLPTPQQNRAVVGNQGRSLQDILNSIGQGATTIGSNVISGINTAASAFNPTNPLNALGLVGAFQ